MNSLSILDEVKWLIRPLKTSDPAYTHLIISDLGRRIAVTRAAIPPQGSTIDTSKSLDRAILSCHEALAGAERLIQEIGLSKIAGIEITESNLDMLTGQFAQILIYHSSITSHFTSKEAGSKGGKASKRNDLVCDELLLLFEQKPGIDPQSAWECISGDIKQRIKFKTFYQNYFLPLRNNSQ